ncbi:MAG: carbohydrate-binding family 9-like protein [Bryobacteraceae bacterium]
MIRTLFAACSISLIAADSSTLLSSHIARDFDLTANPSAKQWRKAPSVVTSNERWGKPVPGARTEIRSRWSDGNLYFLFISQYETLHRQPNAPLDRDSWGMWDYDVAEVFIGDDLERIHLYKEFEVSPWGEWIDLDVDKKREGKMVDADWNSGFKIRTRIDEKKKMWYCEMQIPWRAVKRQPAKAGEELRLNLYRIEGAGESRKYIAWRPVNAPSYHTPEAFGRLRLQ